MTVRSPRRGRALRHAEQALAIPRGRLLAAIAAACATLASAFALAAVSGYLVTRAWTMPPVLDLTVAVVAVRALGVSRGAFRWLDRMLTHDVAFRGVVNLRTTLFTTLAARPGDTVTRLRRGDLLSRLGDDAQELGDHVITAVVPGIVAAVMGVVVLGTVMPISVPAGLAMLAALLLATALAPTAAYRAALITEEAVVTSRSRVSASALEILDDATSLRIDGRLEAALEGLRRDQASHDAAIDRAALPGAVASAAVPLAMILAVTGSVLAAGAAWVDGGASAGLIGILLLLPLSSFEAASALPAAASQYARSRAAADRLAELTASAPDQAASAAAPTARPASRNRAVEVRPAPARTDEVLTRTDLCVQGLSAGWSAGSPRIRDLDLDLPAGSRLAVTGPSGIGKSTLLFTLAGLLAPLSGTITLDGQDITVPGAPTLRSRTTFFAEDAHVFATTLRENLRVVRGDLRDDEALAALHAVGLGEWMRTVPHGLDTVLGPDGTTVSGGERRRLLLARAVLRRGPILLLDEPTEHLDAERGDALLRALLTPGDETLLPASSTVIVVTHQTQAIPTGTPVLRISDDGCTRMEERT